MLRKLLILLCLICAMNAIAQKTNSAPSKTTEKKNDPNIDYKQVGAPMPWLTMIPFYDSISLVPEQDRKKIVLSKDLDNNGTLFVMMFNPTCSHCQDETIQLEKNIDMFAKSKVVLLANKIMRQYLNDFVTLTNLNKYPSIQLGIDSTDFINSVFLYQSLPQINIYSSDRKLIRTFTGEVAIDTLKQYIR